MEDGQKMSYYDTDRYKGFYKSQAHNDGSSRLTHLVFTNGNDKVVACGLYREDAMFKIFAAIDQFYLAGANKTEVEKHQAEHRLPDVEKYNLEELEFFLAEAV